MLVLALSLLLPLVLVFLLWRRRGKSAHESIHAAPNEAAEPAAAPSTSRRRMQRRAATSGASSSNAVVNQELDEADEDEAEEGEYYVAKSSKKKEQKKREKEARRQAESAARDLRKEKQDKQAELRRRRDEEREAEEQRKEEELRKQKEKEEAAAAEEFEKWKNSFSVDTEGTSGENTEEGQSLINDFVEYIKRHKCIPLEDLAAEFHLRTKDCINRIISLEQMGRISGVMDDRGKFIYISPEEMKAVADYIKREGRVSISHLAKKSNEFIDLETKQDVKLDDQLFQDGITVA